MYEAEKNRESDGADLEESQIEEVKMESPETTQEGGWRTGFETLMICDRVVEGRLEVRKGGENQEEQQKAVVEKQQKEEGMMAARFGRNEQRQESGLW